MKILLINGSPKGKRSNSLKLAYSFIEGFKNGCTNDEESISIDELHVASMNIAACKDALRAGRKHLAYAVSRMICKRLLKN